MARKLSKSKQQQKIEIFFNTKETNIFSLILKCISQLSIPLCKQLSFLNKTKNFLLWWHFSPLISGLYEFELFNLQCIILSSFLLGKTFDLYENMLWFENNDLGLTKESRAISKIMQNYDAFSSRQCHISCSVLSRSWSPIQHICFEKLHR